MNRTITSPQKIKIACIGERSTGKSTFLSKIFEDIGQDIEPTIGVEQYSLNLDLDVLETPIMCWDCSGDLKYRNLVTEIYAPHIEAILFFYDASKMSTLSVTLEHWIHNMHLSVEKHVPIILVANQTDKIKTEETITLGKKIAKENNFLFRQCSGLYDSKAHLIKILQKITEMVLLKNKERYKKFLLSEPKESAFLGWLNEKTKISPVVRN